MFENLKAARSWLDVSLEQGHDVVAQLAAKGLDGVLFAEDVTAGEDFLIPETPKQANGTAPWVNTSGDTLTSLGVPVDDPIYLFVWIEKKQDYYMVGGIIRELSFGRTILEAVE